MPIPDKNCVPVYGATGLLWFFSVFLWAIRDLIRALKGHQQVSHVGSHNVLSDTLELSLLKRQSVIRAYCQKIKVSYGHINKWSVISGNNKKFIGVKCPQG